MSSCSQHKCFTSSHLFTICGDSKNDLYTFPLLHIQTASRVREAEIILLRASGNLERFWALQLSAQSTHKYVVVVEHAAATANTTSHGPFLWTQTVFYPTCEHLTLSLFSWCVFCNNTKLEIILLLFCFRFQWIMQALITIQISPNFS